MPDIRPLNACAAVVCALQVLPANAATTSGSDPGATLLAPVIITASPVGSERWQSPATVDSIDGEQLREGQAQILLSEGLVRVPGLVVQNRQNLAQDLQISVRGFGARSTFGVRGLKLYVDGIPASAPDGQGQAANFPIGNADRVDVVRGPAAVLYGNGAGGALLLYTEDGTQPGPGAAASPWGRTGFGACRPSCRAAWVNIRTAGAMHCISIASPPTARALSPPATAAPCM